MCFFKNKIVFFTPHENLLQKSNIWFLIFLEIGFAKVGIQYLKFKTQLIFKST